VTALETFVAESNQIEGIHRVTGYEVDAHAVLLSLSTLTIEAVEGFVRDVAAAPLRDKPGMNVRVGSHVPPPGGPEIREQLEGFLWGLSQPANYTPYSAHVWYESLHPFMDGNGRSGRAVWAWYMRKLNLDPFALPFLHRFYYQALDASRDSA
jgi:Fic family protein